MTNFLKSFSSFKKDKHKQTNHDAFGVDDYASGSNMAAGVGTIGVAPPGKRGGLNRPADAVGVSISVYNKPTIVKHYTLRTSQDYRSQYKEICRLFDARAEKYFLVWKLSAPRGSFLNDHLEAAPVVVQPGNISTVTDGATLELHPKDSLIDTFGRIFDSHARRIHTDCNEETVMSLTAFLDHVQFNSLHSEDVQNGFVDQNVFSQCITLLQDVTRYIDTFAAAENVPRNVYASCLRSIFILLLMLKKKLANKIFGYLARCEFWTKLRPRFWIL